MEKSRIFLENESTVKENGNNNQIRKGENYHNKVTNK